jgi:hypothetical protein
MLRIKKTLLTVLTFLLLSSVAYGDFSKAGRTSLQFLKIGIGARPVSMGEACIANVYGVNSVFWNPAAIAYIQGGEVGFNYARWIGDLDLMAGAIAYNWEMIGAFSVYFVGLDYGDIEEALTISPTGNLDTRTGSFFTGNDMAIGLSYARKFTEQLSIGISLKYLREELFTYNTSMVSFDIGSYYDTRWKGIRLAMTAQNFAEQARFLETKEEFEQQYELPLVFRIGWSIDLLGGENLFFGGNPELHKLSFNMDAVHTNDFAERLHMGMEYWLFNKFSLRAGYRFNYDEGNLSVGAGLDYPVGSMNLRVDYAYVDYDFLDATHRLSIIIGL